ncbi:YkvA family protein [Bacteroidia bacterium]|nr:YkvA family protein [Bacteroidia bacterium]MDB9882025.1 YkvA family protein [Bacteroidia bacterium]
MKIKSLAKAVALAQQIFKNKDKIKDVFNDSTKKAENNKDKMGSGLWGDVKTLRTMLKAWQSGTYKFSKRIVVYVIAGLLYFVSPVDIIPDFLLGVGFIDDAAVLAIIVKRIKSELDRFKSETTYQDAEVIS